MSAHDDTGGDGGARPILVLGATGMTGSRVVRWLRADGRPVRAASRTSEWNFDWQDPTTWDPVLAGVRAAYVVQFDPEPLTPAFVERAAAQGVERVVLLSGRGVDDPDYFPQAITADADFVPTHLVGERAGDIAAVAVAALTEPGHHGRTYELSGPRALTLDDVAGKVSRALGREVAYTPVTVEEFVAERVAAGEDAEAARGLALALSPISRGKDAHLSPGVHEALGRESRGFDAFAAEAAASGVWDH
ncbi:SDR family NAD(P)-dependent oxidoreductase [Nocardiopsis sp. MG754419]|uniref:SDR family NAD(P)-dependent oxidoreductase n=1 Tax=Nocardiopsis sp. MG754419 TaxID=2259865 RepID=UPI002011D50D|nr:SDR family NAD(P)-dependent oxidoreductase [Nocardiopsis sp. MG754419]MBR8745005.1 SDR family NAD(P)-dependent oxidoreductase [Nocardiopsis sp. MG754419]